jgi:hypothetical protein
MWELFVGARTGPIDTSWGSIVDIDGDGLADFVTTVWSEANTQVPAVFLGTRTGPATAPVPLVAPWAQLRLNWVAASAGDVNGDGYADLIVGNQGLTAELYLGGPGWASRAPIEIASPTGPLPSGFGNIFASSVAGAGDVNGDGYGDVVIGSPVNDNHPPLTYVYFGGKDGPTAKPQILTSTAEAFAGNVAGAGDINGDGYGDVAIASNGAVFSFLGGPTGLVAGATLRTGAGDNNLASARRRERRRLLRHPDGESLRSRRHLADLRGERWRRALLAGHRFGAEWRGHTSRVGRCQRWRRER